MKALDRLILVAVAVGLFGVASTLSARGSGDDRAPATKEKPACRSIDKSGFELRVIDTFQDAALGADNRLKIEERRLFSLRDTNTGREWIGVEGLGFAEASRK
jgi:hypothetical protein